MALMTPRGLKIRLPIEHAFALLARLWRTDRRTDAFRVLKTCEAIEDIPTVMATGAGAAAAFWPASPTYAMPLAIVLGQVFGVLLTQFGVYVIVRPLGLLLAATLFSYIPLWSTLIVQAPIVGFIAWKLGWVPVALWIGAWIGGVIMAWAVRFKLTKWRYNKSGGIILTGSEVNFLNAYRLHADRLNVTRDLSVSDEEIESGGWETCLMDYAKKYPEAVARFIQ